jgi:hypothetical protein
VNAREELAFDQVADDLSLGIDIISAEVRQILANQVRRICELFSAPPADLYGHDAGVTVVDVSDRIAVEGIFRFCAGSDVD